MQLLDRTPTPRDYVIGADSIQQHAAATSAAEHLGRPLYEEMLRLHRLELQSARDRKEHSFDSRRRTIERVGLSAVRQHRLNAIDQEERRWRVESSASDISYPELTPRLLLRVEGVGNV